MPRCSARLRMISTRQRGIYNIAHKKRAIVTNTIEKMMAKIASPRMARLIATPCRSGSRAPVALASRARHPAYSCRFDVFYIGVPHEDCDAIPFPHFVIEFCARHMLNDGSVRIERSQPRPTGVLWNPNNVINKLELEAATKNADTLGLTVTPFEVRAVSEFEGAFAAMEREHIDATLILSNPLTFPNRVEMTAFALRHHVPTMVSLREYVEAGALMSYGPSYADHCRQAANYVDQILKGAKPADLPVQLPTEFELTVNSKTAKALGLTIPSSIVLSANIVE